MAYLNFSHDVTRLNHLSNQVMREITGYEGVKLIDVYCCKSHHVTLTICCVIIFSGTVSYPLYRSNIFKFLVVLFGSFACEHELIFLTTNSQSKHCKCHVLFLLR
jgi:hypothetical protein